jgi:hypothetical protein
MEIFYISFVFSFILIWLQGWKKSILSPSKYFAWVLYFPNLIGTVSTFYMFGLTFDKVTFNTASVFIILFGIFYYFGYHAPFNLNFFNFLLPSYMEISIPKARLIITALLTISIGIFLLLIPLTGFNPIFSPLEFRIASSHYYGAINLFISSFIYLALYYSILIKDEHSSNNRLFWFSLTIALGFAILSGSRGALIQLVTLFGIHREVYLRKIIKPQLITIVLLMAIIYSIFYNVYRTSGGFNVDNEALSYYSSELFLRFDTIVNFLKVIDAANSGHIAFLNGSSILDAVQIFIPRIIWSDKPLIISRRLQEYFSDFSSGADILSEQSSAYYLAEAFLNFRIMGATIYGFIQGGLIRSFDNYYDNAIKKQSSANVFVSMYILSANYLDFPMEGLSAMRFPLFISNIAIIWFIHMYFGRKKELKC